MNNEDKKKVYVTAILIAVAIIILLWMRKNNNPVYRIIKDAVNQLLPGGFGDTYEGATFTGDTYEVGGLQYTPAQFPSISSTKCDSNSPCVFCSIPNAVYPATPKTSVAKPSVETAYVTAPKSFTGTTIGQSAPTNTPIVFGDNSYNANYGHINLRF